MHYTSPSSGTITGLLYRGDGKHKYTKPNEPTISRFVRVDPYDVAAYVKMNNFNEAS